MYINRAIEKTIRRAGSGFKAVLVTGPRQVGKSTVLRHLFGDRKYVTFDDPTLLAETMREPGLFFRNNKPPIILDEAQYIAELFPYIKIECDKREEKDLFALTGSQQYHLMQNVSESLAGRIAVLELAGLSLREIQGIDFNEVFLPNTAYIQARAACFQECDDIWKVIHRGGYPELVKEGMDWQMFFGSYLQTYIERDINQLSKVHDKTKFVQFMSTLAARTGQLLNYSSLSNELEISAATVKNWVSLLETSGIVYLLQPFSNPALKRAIKTPKLYFRDTGLACFLARYQTPEIASTGAIAGNLFETFVVSEILKSYSNAGKDYRLYVTYYRGKDKQRKQRNEAMEAKESEIDLIIEENGTLYPIEIKLSANPRLDMTNAFDVLDRVPGKNRGTGAIICMYDQPLWLKDNIVALPVEYI